MCEVKILFMVLFEGFIHQMRVETEPITDFYPAVQPFCETLEEIFRRGLRGNFKL